MRRRLVALVIAVSLVLLPLPADAKTHLPLKSVQALQSAGRTFCTAFAVAPERWMSAGHCGAYALELWESGKDVMLMGVPATAVQIDTDYDIAVFTVAVVAPPIRLADRAPEVGDEIAIAGFPWGVPKLVTTWGRVSARRMPVYHPTYDAIMLSDVLDITTSPGNSGSPVFNAKGELISLLWGGFTSSAHALSVPYEALAPYWE